MRIRVKFAKKESVRYLGHLDIMRFFQRCFNRAGIRMEYSAGYNPHQKMSFAQPLGVGILSEGEYLDAEVADGQEPAEICRRLDAVCGDGFSVLSVRAVEEGAEKAMAALQYASYDMDVADLLSGSGFASPEDFLGHALSALLAKESVPVIKKTKKGEKEIDIRPLICSLKPVGSLIRATVTAGSDNNLKPDILLRAVFADSPIEYRFENVTIKRRGLFAKDYIPLEQYQTI